MLFFTYYQSEGLEGGLDLFSSQKEKKQKNGSSVVIGESPFYLGKS